MSPRALIHLAVCAVLWLSSATAMAATPLTFDLEEDDAGVTVKVRGVNTDAADRKVVTSRGGYLLFFDGYQAKAQRLKPTAKHRLGFVQIGQSKHRVALRISQSARSKGALSTFVESTPVDGGVDIRIADTAEGPVPATSDGELVEIGDPEDPTARASTLAALESSLLAEAELDPATADAPAPIVVGSVAADPELAGAPSDATPGQADVAPDALGGAPAVLPEPGASASLDASDGPPSSDSLMRGGLALLMLVGAAAGVALWMRRRAAAVSGAALDVVSRVGIGPKQSVVWIRAGSRELLLGATERRIEVLAELGDAQPTAADLRSATAAHARPASPPPPQRKEDPAPARIAAFKARLEQALGSELAGNEDLDLGDDADMPAHLRLLAGDPKWTENEQGVA